MNIAQKHWHGLFILFSISGSISYLRLWQLTLRRAEQKLLKCPYMNMHTKHIQCISRRYGNSVYLIYRYSKLWNSHYKFVKVHAFHLTWEFNLFPELSKCIFTCKDDFTYNFLYRDTPIRLYLCNCYHNVDVLTIFA